MRDRIVWGLMRLLARLAYGYWPAAVHIVRELSAEEREHQARELAAKVVAEMGQHRRRYRMGEDDYSDLPAITQALIKEPN